MSNLPLVKIRRSGERIWVQMTDILSPTHAKGIVDSDVINEDGVQYGDEVFFKRDEVLDYWVN